MTSMILPSVLLPVMLTLPVTSGGRVILIVTEGLTESLISRVPTPAIDALMSQGTIASLKPEFPSETLPTLAAMVTGQHSEVTGVLDRQVQDPAGNILHANSDPEFWQYNQNLTTIMDLNSHVAGHRTGCILWQGEKFQSSCDEMWSYDIVVDITSLDNKTGHRKKRNTDVDYDQEESDFFEVEEISKETESEKVDTNTETGEFFINKTTDQEWLMWESQISTTINWLTLEKDPVNLILFNVYQPGNYIRTFGPNGQEAAFAVQKVDQMIARLVEQLQRKNLFEEVNIVLTGAHGFAEITADKVFDISQYLPDKNSHVLVGHSPVLNIFHSEKDLTIYASLSRGPKDEKYDLYIHKDIPEEYHYKDNDRVGTMTLVAKEGFAFFDVWDDFKELNAEHHRKELLENSYGIAGYDNSLESMQSILILHGPNIQPLQGPEHSKPKINAVDVFPLLTHLLELPSVKTNGSMSAVRNIFKYPPSQSIEAIKKVFKYYTEEDKLPKTVSVLVISTLSLILLICCGACAVKRRNRNLGKNHNYKYSSVKHNRRSEGGGREDGSVGEAGDDKVGLLTSALMEEELEENMSV